MTLPSGPTRPGSSGLTPADSETPEAKIAAIASWLGQFSRTLKTCRLYDAHNPTAVAFRTELGANMVALLEAHGSFTLEFSSQEVACEGHPVQAARAREDNFAMPFYRDGLRTLTFNPDTEPRELDVIVDLLLRVTSTTSNGSEDLVTLLWDADLPHVDMSYVSSETDADLDDCDDGPDGGTPSIRGEKLMPWPVCGGAPGVAMSARAALLDPTSRRPGTGGAGSGEAAGGTHPADGVSASGMMERIDADGRQRSDDWVAGEPADELEATFQSLDSSSAEDVDRFISVLNQDRSLGLVAGTMALVREAMRSDLVDADRADLQDLVLRVLHESIGSASWPDARDAVDFLTECTEGKWFASSMIEALSQADSPVTAALVRHLDGHPLVETHEFVAFARSLGPAAIEWLMGVIAIARHQRTRRTLVRALGDLCSENPERLGPWLADSRWYVVRNAVIAVSSAQGGPPVELLRPLVKHSEPRVRQEVVAALANASADAAWPLLLELAADCEPAIRSTALRRLGSRRDPKVSAALLEKMLDPDFRRQPIEDVRSVATALGGCAGEEALPHLEEQLYPPGWFTIGAGPYSQVIAHTIARIGTPAAIAILEHGARSRIPATRDACRLVLKGMGRA